MRKDEMCYFPLRLKDLEILIGALEYQDQQLDAPDWGDLHSRLTKLQTDWEVL